VCIQNFSSLASKLREDTEGRRDGGSDVPGQIFVARVSYLWFGYGFGKFPLKMSNFSIFCPSGQKNVIGVGLKKYPGQSQVSLLFTAVQKYVRVGLGRVRAHL